MFKGIQVKLWGIFAVVLVLAMGAVAFSLFGLHRISQVSSLITKEEIPLVRSTHEAFGALIGGEGSFENALLINSFSEREQLQSSEAEFRREINRFSMFIAAITWGSESAAFARSAGGLNLAEWKRAGFERNLTIKTPSPAQAQLAGQSSLYFGGFVQNAQKALAVHKKSLRVLHEGQFEESERLREESVLYQGRADRFFQLTEESLNQIIELSNAATASAIAHINEVQRTVFVFVFIVFAGSFLLAFLASGIFTRRVIVKPLVSLMASAKKIAEGNLNQRVSIESSDEIGSLATAFNEMADTLKASHENLEEKVRLRTEELHTQIQELDKTAKLLVRRDFELLQANEILRELDELKSSFVSIAAHQLRTPLTGIKWTLHSLLEESAGKLNAEQKKIAGDGYEAANRLVELVNDLLDLARLEEGRFGFQLKKQEFLPVVKDAWKRLKQTADEKGVKLLLQVSKAPIPLLNFDEEKISIVLMNLLDNGIKYTSPGGEVRVRVLERQKEVVCEVRDTGIGIPLDQFNEVFTKFFRGANAQLAQTSGTGLGLYVAKTIVEHHQGKMSFESEEDKGSVFSFSLPIPGAEPLEKK